MHFHVEPPLSTTSQLQSDILACEGRRHDAHQTQPTTYFACCQTDQYFLSGISGLPHCHWSPSITVVVVARPHPRCIAFGPNLKPSEKDLRNWRLFPISPNRDTFERVPLLQLSQPPPTSFCGIRPATAPKMFTLFPKLPTELRCIIWALAIRPEQPNAHFFTVFKSSNDDEWSLLSQHSISHPSRRSSLAAPEIPTTNDGSQQRQFSWVQGNRSAYMIDRGLWTACRESREVIERRFRVAEWDIKRGAMNFMAFREDPPNAPATVSFILTANNNAV